MTDMHGPLLRDLIATADHPIGNIPPAARLSDLVGTEDWPTENLGQFTQNVDMLDLLAEWAS